MIRRALPWLAESGSDGREGSEREVDLPLDWSEQVDLPLDWSDREVGCGLERESRVERGREEEKAVGVAEGCLCVILLERGACVSYHYRGMPVRHIVRKRGGCFWC